MEPEVTLTAPIDPLQEWWNQSEFDGKQHCTLKEDGTLELNATSTTPARSLGQLTADKADATVRALAGKFPEVTARVDELQKDWDAAEDKMKLAGKVARLHDYLQNAPAIGDFGPLQERVMEWVKVVQAGLEENEKARMALVEKAEGLVQSNEWKETTAAFKELTEQWKKAGASDKANQDVLWQRIENAREAFFERKRQAHEDQEKDMLQNLDLKMEIVEKAEALAASETWKQSTEAFKTLMEEWKATGRTMADKNEALWQRFIAAKNVFFERKRQHFELIQAEQEVNYGTKLALVEKAEGLAESKEWNKTSNAYAEIMEAWKKSGRVPADKADALWDRLHAAKEIFFGARRQHFEGVKVNQEDNFAQKQALVKRAEVLKNSTQWRDATIEFNELMDAWKQIGHVARSHGDSLWETFIGARRTFFERKDADRDKRKEQIEKNQSVRVQQTRQFHETLQAEYAEDEASIADFKESLANLPAEGGSKKDVELRNHLTRLIADTEKGLARKHQKIASVAQQLEELEKPRKPANDRKPDAKHSPDADEQAAPATGTQDNEASKATAATEEATLAVSADAAPLEEQQTETTAESIAENADEESGESPQAGAAS